MYFVTVQAFVPEQTYIAAHVYACALVRAMRDTGIGQSGSGQPGSEMGMDQIGPAVEPSLDPTVCPGSMSAPDGICPRCVDRVFEHQ